MARRRGGPLPRSGRDAGVKRAAAAVAEVLPAAGTSGDGPLPQTDLTRPRGYDGVDGARIVDVAASTLTAAETLIATWTSLEPVVKGLIAKVAKYAERPSVDEEKATALLKDSANVTRAVAGAATAVMRAAEGQARLAVLIRPPEIVRSAPAALTEKQLVAVVLETARRVRREHGGRCPLCNKPAEGWGTRDVPALEAPADATNGGAPAS